MNICRSKVTHEVFTGRGLGGNANELLDIHSIFTTSMLRDARLTNYGAIGARVRHSDEIETTGDDGWGVSGAAMGGEARTIMNRCVDGRWTRSNEGGDRIGSHK
jgi:hypothetical protein